MNKNIEWFTLVDWTGNELGRFETLEDMEEAMYNIVNNDLDVKELEKSQKEEMDKMISEGKINPDRVKAMEIKLEDLKESIYGDLYMEGLDKNGKRVGIDFS